MNVEVELKEHIQSTYYQNPFGYKGTLHGGVTMRMTKVRFQYWIQH